MSRHGGTALASAESPIYAWPFDERHVWRSSEMSALARLLERATGAR